MSFKLNHDTTQSDPGSCQKFYDLVEDLQNEFKGDRAQPYQSNIKIAPSPRVLIRMKDIEVRALIDTGSQVTCIAEEFYKKLLTIGALLEMPMSNIYVTTAVTQKKTAVKRQIMSLVIIEQQSLSDVFLVIPFLSSPD